MVSFSPCPKPKTNLIQHHQGFKFEHVIFLLMHFCTSMFSPGNHRKNIFIIFPGHTQTLEGGGGQPNIQSTKLWIILVHYSDTCTSLQPQTDQKPWSAKSGWSRSEDHMSTPNSSSYFYTSFIYCHLIAITSMDRDPSPYFSGMSAHPSHYLSENLEHPTNDSEHQQFFNSSFLDQVWVNREQK